MTPLIVTVGSLYKRNKIPASLPDPGSIAGKVVKGYKFDGIFIPSGPGQAPGGWYKDSLNNYYWAGGVSVQNQAPQNTAVTATVLGIDVSGYQQDSAIHWPQVKQSISFVYIKASEGINTVDALCKAHANGAVAAELKIGYYHFAIVSKDAVEQARHFDNVMKGLPAASLPPVLDVETNKADLSPEEMEAWIATFINTMNSLGYSKSNDLQLYFIP
jgi:GH25 family lysozyme M1 (1,4-beta-N-acetylmuramidase)